MNLLQHTVFFPYVIGLGVGLGYYLLFTRAEIWKTPVLPPRQNLYFVLGGFALHAGVAGVCFMLLKPLLLDSSFFQTNWIASLCMGSFCLTTSLFLFGVIKIPDLTIQPVDNSHTSGPLFAKLRQLLLTPHMGWASFHAVALSVYFWQGSAAILLPFLGLFTAFLFQYFRYHREFAS